MMVWCYRVAATFDVTQPSVSMSDLKALAQAGQLSDEQIAKIDLEFRQSQAFWHQLGWDGHKTSTRLFTVPGLYHTMFGFMVKSDSDGFTYIGSPIPLPHIAKQLDWNAQVSHEDIQRARDAIDDENREAKAAASAVNVEPWSVSVKGNIYTRINGLGVTVYGDPVRGFQAIVNPHGKPPVRTRKFQTQIDCRRYVENHFHDILNTRIEPAHAVSPDDDW